MFVESLRRSQKMFYCSRHVASHERIVNGRPMSVAVTDSM